MKIALYFTFILLLIPGCGKSLHFSQKAQTGKGAAQVPVDSDGRQGPAQGSAGQVSEYDVTDPDWVLPFRNPDPLKAPYRLLGHPEAKVSDGTSSLGYVVHSNLVFRFLIQVPPRDPAFKIKTFKLVLDGARRYFAPGAAGNDLRGQVLCLLDGKACSGEAPSGATANDSFWSSVHVLNDSFARIPMSHTAQVGADGSRILSSSANLEIDLLDLYGLSSKSDEERAAWIYAHSTEFGAPGFRKFRFAIGDQVYFDHGSLLLEVDPETRAPGEPQGPVHGVRDTRDATQPEDRVAPSAGGSSASSPPAGASGVTGPVIPPPTPPSDPSVATPIHRAADLDWKFDSETLMFATGSAAIAHSSVLKLGKTGELFKSHLKSIRRIEVIGQTDQQGKTAFNQGLSLRRAAAVRAVLLKNGIPSGTIHSSGVGEPKVSSCAPLEKCAKDRIVVIKMDLADQLTPGEKSDLGLEMNQGLGRIWFAQ